MTSAGRPPEYGARGVMFGLGIALLPALGLQMVMVLAWWWVVRRFLPRLDFHLVVALAWTWVTNVVTFPPLIYLYVTTGRLMLGRWERIGDFRTFSDRLDAALAPNADWLTRTIGWLEMIADRFALPLLIGMVPWLVLLSWLSYRLTLRWLRARQHRIARRQARRKARRLARLGREKGSSD